ncbi:MAG: hypothetical protein KH225_08855 [Proteobacteria bacterium]|nr:hypothetical protein [Pseudomonadota bacterium]
MDEQQKRIAWKLTPEAEDMLMTVFSTEAGRDDAVLLALRDLVVQSINTLSIK